LIAFQTVLPLFLIIIIGMIFSRAKVNPENWIEVSGLKAIIIDAAMPLGVTPYVLAVQYKLKTTLVARIIVFGTLLSIIVIPLWIIVMG
ncbi:MAG: AEC family transporter, partial [Mariniphaga sp.]